MARPKKDQEDTPQGVSTVSQIQSYLKTNKEDHYNFEEPQLYTVSSGSLILDMEMGGGIRPGILRFSGVSEGGKTSAALSFARNFQKSIDNSFVIYIKSEGRLSKEVLERSGVDLSESKWFEYKSNVYESVISLMRQLVKSNPDGKKYLFIIDSMDALVPRADLERPFEEANKVAGGSLLSSDFLRKMALGLSSKGHTCIMISQVRSAVTINPYAKTDPKITNASGGNALLHYSDWILEFQQRHKADLIFGESSGPKINKNKEDILGHYCKIVFRKSINEKTNKEVRYPIKYGRKNGQSVWVEQEIKDVLLMWNLVKASGAWITISDDLIKELSSKNIEVEKQHQGEDNFVNYLEKNTKMTEYLFDKFRKIFENQ
jgi:RecA/RadA recombinase